MLNLFLLAFALLCGLLNAQTASCNHYPITPPSTTPTCSCNTVPRIGTSVELWYPQTSRVLPPPPSLQVMYIGPESIGYTISWGPGVAQKIVDWIPETFVALRVMQDMPPAPNCSIPLHECVYDATIAASIAIPNDPGLIGTRWWAGTIEAFVLGPPLTLYLPEHQPSRDVLITVGT